jgi:hypothetical protein
MDGKAVIQAPIFPTLLIANRQDWLAAPKDTKCYVQFNPLVTACINHLTYRDCSESTGLLPEDVYRKIRV